MFYKLKKLLSFFYPILIERFPSKISGNIEVSLQNGNLVIDSTSANYSYGSLHKLFQKIIKRIKFNSERKKVLILGFGGGSIAEILNNEKQLNLDIVGVEKDIVVVKIYNNLFKKKIHNTVLIEGDALVFMKTNSQKFDYIFIDIFNNLNVPEGFKTQTFLNLLNETCLPHTQIVMNTTLKVSDNFVNLWKNQFKEKALVNKMTDINLVFFSLP